MEQLSLAARRSLRIGMLAGCAAYEASDLYAAYETVATALQAYIVEGEDPSDDDLNTLLGTLGMAADKREFRQSFRAVARWAAENGLDIRPI